MLHPRSLHDRLSAEQTGEMSILALIPLVLSLVSLNPFSTLAKHLPMTASASGSTNPEGRVSKVHSHGA